MTHYKGLSPEAWEQIEREEHDRHYRNSTPFHSGSMKINISQVKKWEDYCYKKGRRKDRGHRTRRVFEYMGIDDLKGKKILDAGCGNGQYTTFFAMLGARAYGIDISPVGITLAQKIARINGVADRCHFSVQSIAETDYPDNTFDIVLMHEVLHHAIKYPGVKKEILRILKKGGFFICAESIDGNFLLRLARKYTMKGIEAKGDVVMDRTDLINFGEGFSWHKVELMSMFFMGKRVFRRMMHLSAIRVLMLLTRILDKALLTVFPGLRKYCGEAILIARK